jgi:hypothetical protein
VGNLDGAEDFVLEIRTLDSAGVPTAVILAAATITDLPAIASDQTLTLTGVFDPPAPVTTGVGYAVVVTGAVPDFFLRGRSLEVCPGQLFRDDLAIGSFTIVPTADMVFSASIVV